MTYKRDDLRYHDHEHGPDCPIDPATVPKETRRTMGPGEYDRMLRKFYEHRNEFPPETCGVALIVAGIDASGEAMDTALEGPDDVLTLALDLIRLHRQMRGLPPTVTMDEMQSLAKIAGTR